MKQEELLKTYLPLLEEKLTPYRLRHSKGVAQAAFHLAGQYGADPDKAYLAGLLHDILKDTPKEEQFTILTNSGILLDEISLQSPKLWHAMAGAIYVRDTLSILDEDIFHAIFYHTTGRVFESRLEEVIYLADFISEDRDYPDVGVVRALCAQSLESAGLYVTAYTLQSLTKQRALLHPNTLALYNRYCEKNKKREGKPQ